MMMFVAHSNRVIVRNIYCQCREMIKEDSAVVKQLWGRERRGGVLRIYMSSQEALLTAVG